MTGSRVFDCAVVIPSVLRPVLARAVRSVYAQDFPGTVQILVGVDVARGDAGIIDTLRAECPERMALSVLDLGYSTSVRNGGFYDIWGGGSLRTILSYAANSRYVAYLDDDNWWAPNHLSSLRAAIEGHDWAHSYRWYVDPDSEQPLCIDQWESVGVGRGMYAKLYKYNGHVDANCYMLDKEKCHWVLPAWSVPHPHSKTTHRRGGAGEDRTLFHVLQMKFKGACTGQATTYYVINRNWQRVLKYILDPVDPESLTDVPERNLCLFAAKLVKLSDEEKTVESAHGSR